MSLALVVQLAPSSPQGTASIEGVVVKLGTTDAVVDADVELSRVEGVAEAPMADAASAFFKTVLDGFGPSGAFPPAVIANEVQYAKSDASGRFLFRNLKPGKYLLRLTWPKHCVLSYRLDLSKQSMEQIRIIMDVECAHHE